MVNIAGKNEDREQRLDEAVAFYLRAAQNGAAPPRAEFLAHYPDLQTELVEFLTDEERFARAAAPLQAVSRAVSLPGAGEVIGDYELLDQLAQGGMGVVYRAVQLSLGRVVALKMLRAGRLADDVERQRFRLEAEAVARLDHSGIVPVHEVGEHDGWLFFSMKLIDGGSLAERLSDYAWPDNTALAPIRRTRLLEMFIQVADAVHYAHQRGVLHRDLKPGNILIDAEGRPHVTDFGLAKCMAGLGNSESTIPARPGGPLTETGAVLGTPSYMAPEQALGQVEAITTTADVYSLGAILYELLTGRPPFREASPLLTLHALMERDPARPGTLRPGIDRDLETVCLKCLDKDPARRYGSARELADELRRCLRGEPIQARPAGAWERTRRWCRRNPLVAALTAALLGSFLLGFALVFWQWRRAEDYARQANEHLLAAEEARARALANLWAAQDERGNARADFSLAHGAINALYVRLTDKELADAPGLQSLRKELLQGALKYYQMFEKRHGADATLQAELADVQARMARLTAAIESASAALPASERALAMYRSLVAADPANRALRGQLAAVYHHHGALQQHLGNSEAAAAAYQETRRLYEEILQEKAEDEGALDGLASMLSNLGLRARELGRGSEALECYHQALAYREKLVAVHPADPNQRNNLAGLYNALAAAQELHGDTHTEALATYQKARQIRLDLVARFPQVPRYRRDLAEVNYNLGILYARLGRHPEAVMATSRALALQQELVQREPQVIQYQRDLAASHRSLGVHLTGSKGAGAVTHFERARTIQARLVELDPLVPGYRYELARTLHFLGQSYARLHKRTDALGAYRRSRELYDDLVEADPDNLTYRGGLAGLLQSYGTEQLQAGKLDEAADLLGEAIDHERFAVERAPTTLSYRRSLGRIYGSLGEVQRAAGNVEEAVHLALERRQLQVEDPSELYRCACDLARAAAIADESQRRDVLGLALQLLLEARAHGYRDATALRKEPAWERLRQEGEFQRLLADIDEQHRASGVPLAISRTPTRKRG